ncbi:hypothetical protein PYWP30_00507 [Pyrobaculum sp. WP30]|nr:hypothetical protein PYWP30_00507 [Pyrobaculum sp. WP30]
MYGGSVPRDLKIDAIRQVVREEEYKRCVEGGRRLQMCYVLLADGLIDKFSSPLPSVTHDGEDRFYALKGADGKLLVYDVDKYGVVELSQAAATLFS